MALSGSSSPLVNAFNRKRPLAKVRQALLDMPGIPRRGGPPPPTAPDQTKTSPQQKSLSQAKAAPQQGTSEKPQAPVASQAAPQQAQPRPSMNLDDETRREFLGQIEVFLQQRQKERRAQLHTQLGRTRTFFGSGT